MPKRKPRRAEAAAAQPHDTIIQFTFSQPKHATGLLRAAFPPEIVALIRWRTLKLERVHFVDRGLRRRYADLFFSAEMGGERAFVYVLIEHQRKVEPLMIFRMGLYMWRQWEQLVRDAPNRATLPPILPVLIHHSDTGWTAATRFEDVIQVAGRAREAMRPYIPSFGMRLLDVSGSRASGLVDQALTMLGRLVLWCLSVAGDDARLEREIDLFVKEINAIYTSPRERDALYALMRYLVATHPHVGVDRMAGLLATTAEKGRKEIDVDAIEELKEIGRREGRVEGAAEMLLHLLTARFGEVPDDARARILAATPTMLARWGLRVLTAPTLEAVLGAAAAKKRAAPARRPAARKPARAAR